MKGTLHKSINYGWMVQVGSVSFYPLHPYDKFTNSIARVEGKEVDFILEDFWNVGLDEKLIKVAIISAKIVDVPQQDEILQLAEKSRNAINDVAHLCSGEVEEHIFDIGFYNGYNLAKETYGSKESYEPIELLCSTVEVGKSYLSKGCGIGEVIEYDSIIQMFKVKYQSGNTEYVNLYGLATHVNNITATDFDLMLDKPTSSQTTSDKWKEYQDWLNEVPEISDEEIEQYAKQNAFQYYEFITGAKWYREQLKLKI